MPPDPENSSDRVRGPAKWRNHEGTQETQREQDRRRRGQCGPDGGGLQPLLPQAIWPLGRGEPGGVRRPAGQDTGGPHSDDRADRASGRPPRACPHRHLPGLGALLLRPGAARGLRHAGLSRPPADAVEYRHRPSSRRRLHHDGGLGARLAARPSGPQDGGRRRHAALPADAPPHLVRGAPVGAGPLSAHGRGEPG